MARNITQTLLHYFEMIIMGVAVVPLPIYIDSQLPKIPALLSIFGSIVMISLMSFGYAFLVYRFRCNLVSYLVRYLSYILIQTLIIWITF